MVNTRQIAATGLFAALYFIISVLPGIPVIGLPGMQIELEASFTSIFGAILGPYAGASAALLGTLLTFFYSGVSLTNLTFILSPATNALIVGLVFRHKWKAALVVFVAIVAAFWLTPVAQPIPENWYVGLAATFDKIVAILLIPVVSRLLPSTAVGNRKKEFLPPGPGFLALLLASFIGNQADAALGSTLFAIPLFYQQIWGLQLDFVRFLYVLSPLAYPVIRLLQAFMAAIVGLPLVRMLRARGLIWL